MYVCYIAGPFRADTAWEIAENVRNAERIGLGVSRRGYMPSIPHANTANFHGEGTDAFWLEGTKELMRRCDAVVLVPGWQKSSGTQGEIREARQLGIPVLLYVSDLPPPGMFDRVFPRRAAGGRVVAERWWSRLEEMGANL